MRKWSLTLDRPDFGEIGRFEVVEVSVDWFPSLFDVHGEVLCGHFAVRVLVLGFGVTLIYWRDEPDRDVYGDGGVA